jgi:hypothetical protein
MIRSIVYKEGYWSSVRTIWHINNLYYCSLLTVLNNKIVGSSFKESFDRRVKSMREIISKE